MDNVSILQEGKNQQRGLIEIDTFPDIDHDAFKLLPVSLAFSSFAPRHEPLDNRLQQLARLGFSIRNLCAAIQNKCSVAAIKSYLQSYQGSSRAADCLSRDGWLALYYAAERNAVHIVTVLLQHGIDAKSQPREFFVPLLAYAIIHGEIHAINTSELVKMLLAAGYSPTTVPVDMWINYLEAPTAIMSPSIKLPTDALQSGKWCDTRIRPILARSLHLTHRYFLHLAYSRASMRLRALQNLKAHKMTELSKLPYFLIGRVLRLMQLTSVSLPISP